MPAPAKMLEIAIAAGPECPRCHCDTFDDWRHDPSFRSFGLCLMGRIKCHSCGIYFKVTQYPDGECHSTING